MKKAKVLSAAVAVGLISLFVFVSTSAGVQTEPSTLNYQGMLTDNGGQPLSGSKSITISLYTVPNGGTAFWSDTYIVTLLNGQFSVTLGSDANPLSPQLPQFNGVTYVGVQVGGDPEMTPRQKLTSVAYSLKAKVAETVSNVSGVIPSGVIVMWSGSIASIPAGWALCDGSNGTPNLRDRFIVGAGSAYAVGASGDGATSHTLTLAQLPNHSHIEGSGIHDGGQRDIYGNVSGGSAIWSDWLYADWTTLHAYTSSVGNGETFENRPPYYALAYIMKL